MIGNKFDPCVRLYAGRYRTRARFRDDIDGELRYDVLTLSLERPRPLDVQAAVGSRCEQFRAMLRGGGEPLGLSRPRRLPAKKMMRPLGISRLALPEFHQRWNAVQVIELQPIGC